MGVMIMTKMFIILILGVLCSKEIRASERPYIISGLDDVIRQANNTGLINASLKLLEEDKTFTGMPELYSAIAKDEVAPRFVILSAIPDWFTNRMKNFLDRTQYPERGLVFRSWPGEWSIEDFKMRRISELLRVKKDRKFIVILDNSEASVEFARRLRSYSPTPIVAVYLRQVVQRTPAFPAMGFFSAFDIAVAEFMAKRISATEVTHVGRRILRETNIENLFPSYASCPTTIASCQEETEIHEICKQVSHHLLNLCASNLLH